MKKIVVKLITQCDINKPIVLTVVAKLEGVKSIAIDVDKGTLTVVGTVDPVCIILALRKKKCCAEIESVGEDKKEEPKKPEDDKAKKIEECKKLLAENYCCPPPCVPPAPYIPYRIYEEPSGCTIS